ncbi:hypothetical protein M9458_048629, partial [Cirrhinus mrigala]
MNDVLPGTSPQTARPVCSPVELSDDFDSSSQYGLDLLFEAPAEVSAASEGGREPSEADVSSELAVPVAESQSVADAEMAVALQRAAREIGLEPQRTLVRLQSVPETGSPGKEDRLTCPGPHSTRGRALDSTPSRLSATRQTATTWSIKVQFPSSLGTILSVSDPLYDGQTLFPPTRTCGHTPLVFPHVLKQRVRSDVPPRQGGSSVWFPPHELTGQNSQWSLGLLTSSHRLPPLQ